MVDSGFLPPAAVLPGRRLRASSRSSRPPGRPSRPSSRHRVPVPSSRPPGRPSRPSSRHRVPVPSSRPPGRPSRPSSRHRVPSCRLSGMSSRRPGSIVPVFDVMSFLSSHWFWATLCFNNVLRIGVFLLLFFQNLLLAFLLRTVYIYIHFWVFSDYSCFRLDFH